MTADARANVESVIDDISFYRDNGSTAGTFTIIYPGGPEDLFDLFSTGGFDAVLVVEGPQLRETRYVSNVPTYDEWIVPVRVKCINKYSTGSLVSTAAKILEKVRREVQAHVEGAATGSGYTMKVLDSSSQVRHVAGMDVHECVVNVQYKESQ